MIRLTVFALFLFAWLGYVVVICGQVHECRTRKDAKKVVLFFLNNGFNLKETAINQGQNYQLRDEISSTGVSVTKQKC